MRKLFFLFLALVATTSLWAESFSVGGIYYNYLQGKNVEVTYRGKYYDSCDDEYAGEVIIPSTVRYNGTTYSVTSIGDWAFRESYSLTSVTIPNSVTWIGGGAFCGCSSLTSITIPEGVTSILSSAFYGCSKLTAITIPESVTSIGVEAFERCTSLTSITIPESVTSIEGSAFESCSSLTSIVIPHSITSIGERAFCGCSSLTSVTIPNGYPTSVSIGDQAFYDCSSLTSITIGNGVTSIGESAFEGCSSLADVICKSIAVPMLESDVFFGMPISEATLYVPVQSLGKYKAAAQWNEFGSIVPLEETPNAVDNILSSSINTQKIMRNGQLIILRDGVEYNAMGQEL